MSVYYCSGSDIKDRMNILSSDGTYDVSITGSISEAMSYIDGVLREYTAVPLTGANITTQVRYCAADIAAGIFKRRFMPSEVKMQGSTSDNVTYYEGWWALGVQRLNDFIRSNYKTGSFLICHTGSDL